MTDLITRITAALDAEEALARAVATDRGAVERWDKSQEYDGEFGWDVYTFDAEQDLIIISQKIGYLTAGFIAAQDPYSVLRRIAAQRKVLERHRTEPDEPDFCWTCGDDPSFYSGRGPRRYPCREALSLAESLGVIL